MNQENRPPLVGIIVLVIVLAFLYSHGDSGETSAETGGESTRYVVRYSDSGRPLASWETKTVYESGGSLYFTDLRGRFVLLSPSIKYVVTDDPSALSSRVVAVSSASTSRRKEALRMALEIVHRMNREEAVKSQSWADSLELARLLEAAAAD